MRALLYAPEEKLILDCYRQLTSEFPHLRLVIAPRHRERFDEVADLIRDGGLPLTRRSTADCPDAVSQPVVLLDTLGELSSCWGLAPGHG